MRFTAFCILALSLAAFGCSSQPADGITAPKNDAFVGRLVHNGKPVSFPEGEKVQLKLVFSEKAQSFGVPIKPDGTFTIGWMHIGKYSGLLIREKTVKGRVTPANHGLPEAFEIVAGKTEYDIELGANYKP